MANNKVKFLRGTSNEYTVAEKDNDTIYFTTDDGKLYIGDKEVSGESIKALNSHINDNVKHITSTERTNWNAAKTHADSPHAPSNAQANIIETVKVNGTALTPSNKAVNITVPTVGNGTITIKQAGTTKGTFTTNQSGNTTINLDGGGSTVDNIDGIPVDLTGIYNTQMIGYDEEQGKLVPMSAVAKTQTVLPSNQTPRIWELTEASESSGSENTSYNYPCYHFNQIGLNNSWKAIFTFKEPFMLSEFNTIKAQVYFISKYCTFKVVFSKRADFATVDAEYTITGGGSEIHTINIANLQGKYYMRFEYIAVYVPSSTGGDMYIKEFTMS